MASLRKFICLLLFVGLAASVCRAGKPPVFDLKTAADAILGPGDRFESYLDNLNSYFAGNGTLKTDQPDEESRKEELDRQWIQKVPNRFPESFRKTFRGQLLLVSLNPLHSCRLKPALLRDVQVVPSWLFVNSNPVHSMPIKNSFSEASSFLGSVESGLHIVSVNPVSSCRLKNRFSFPGSVMVERKVSEQAE